MILPKLTQHEQAGLKSLRQYAAHQSFVKHLQQRLAYFQQALVVASPADVPALQGRARELQDLLEVLTKD